MAASVGNWLKRRRRTNAPTAIDDTPPGGPTLSDWTRVRQLEPSAEITLTTTRSRALTRIFITADDRKVAEIQEIVETIARDDVIEIDGAVVARGSVAAVVSSRGHDPGHG